MAATYSSLSDKVVLVTGSAKGIGAAIARRFAGQRCHVVVNDIDEAAAREVVDDIVKSGGSAMLSIADVSNSEQVGSMIDDTMQEHGRIDVVVNNAGIVSPMLHLSLIHI